MQVREILIGRSKRTEFPSCDYPFVIGRDLYYQQWGILDALLPLILYHRKGSLVEIGMGDSTFFMCKHGHDFKRDVHSCDVNPEKVKTKLFDRHIVHYMKSEDFIRQFEDNPAVVLIDGCHDLATARMEFDFFFGCLVEGGVIFIHDTYPPQKEFMDNTGCGDVWKLRHELEKKHDDYDCFTWPYTSQWMGLTMVIKKEKDRPFWGR